jgi:hypothetical protein
MITDIFWNVATSTPALLIVGTIFVAAFVLAHVPLLSKIPQVAPYVLLAAAIAYLALADLALCIGFRISDERAETRRLKVDLAWRDNEIAQQKASAADAERIAAAKSAEAEVLKAKVDDYEAKLATQPIGDCALDDADLDGLRAFRPAGKHKRSDPARLRGPGLFRPAP